MQPPRSNLNRVLHQPASGWHLNHELNFVVPHFDGLTAAGDFDFLQILIRIEKIVWSVWVVRNFLFVVVGTD
jgi:hypothetical protein